MEIGVGIGICFAIEMEIDIGMKIGTRNDIEFYIGTGIGIWIGN